MLGAGHYKFFLEYIDKLQADLYFYFPNQTPKQKSPENPEDRGAG